jgi:hypothetical protein
MIDSREASEALSDINEIVRRVRQSRTYHLASLTMVLWGALVFAGNIATYLWPYFADYTWLAVYVAGIAGSVSFSAFDYSRSGVHGFDLRMLAAFLLFFAFGFFCTKQLGHFTPRQLGTFWPIYFMLAYSIVGLWFGYAFVLIGVGITALTLIGYFYIDGWAFLPWMAVVNGGGLILGGLWMRRN